MPQISSPRHRRHMATQGQALWQQLDRDLRDSHHGQCIALEVEAGEYGLGETMSDAETTARAQPPGAV